MPTYEIPDEPPGGSIVEFEERVVNRPKYDEDDDLYYTVAYNTDDPGTINQKLTEGENFNKENDVHRHLWQVVGEFGYFSWPALVMNHYGEKVTIIRNGRGE